MSAICTKEQKRHKMKTSHFWKQNPELSDLMSFDFMNSENCFFVNDIFELTEAEKRKMIINCILGTAKEELRDL